VSLRAAQRTLQQTSDLRTALPSEALLCASLAAERYPLGRQQTSVQ
jgi:hypothetical protein